MPFMLMTDPSEQTRCGVWKITERAEELESLITLTDTEWEHYKSFRNETRKKQWLAYRLILSRLLGTSQISIVYNKDGKPLMPDRSCYISVTHSGIFAAAILSDHYPVGIDIEKIGPRIERIKDRFLSQEELTGIGEMNRLEKLYIAWGAKESLYKLAGTTEVDFILDIRIEPFDYLCIAESNCKAWMRIDRVEMLYRVLYRKLEDYMLVYAIKN